MPREPEFDKAYMANFSPFKRTERGLELDESRLFLCARLWQLTNTRFVIGSAGFLPLLNAQVDPGQQRFQIRTRFNVGPKPGVAAVVKPEHLTAVTDTNGQFAVFEFTGALPRAKLFTHWQVNTNDAATLEQLKSPAFDPAQTVLSANDLPAPNPAPSTNQTGGTVEFAHYEPKVIQLDANVAAPSVLMLNDRFNPDWKVLVDGKPEPLLRCNYIMFGAYLSPGKHKVEFRFQPPLTAFYVSLTGLIAGLALCGYLVVTRNSGQKSGSLSNAGGPRSENRQSQIVNRKSK
jgi:hypothetical protein